MIEHIFAAIGVVVVVIAVIGGGGLYLLKGLKPGDLP